MGVYAGPADWWVDNTDAGRIHITTKAVVQSGLVLNLDAGASTSYDGTGVTWTDLSGNGRNGTLANGPTYNSGNGGYIVFDGTNDYVSFTYTQPAYNTTTSFSWNVWIYPISNSVNHVVMGNRGGTGNTNFTKLTTSRFEYYPTNLVSAMPLNVWQNVCIIKDQTNLYYYRNASLVVSTTSSATKTSTSFYVGGDPTTDTPEYIDSRIAQVSIYNRALTASEVSQNFNVLRGRFGI